jgi:hypothetical protein
MVAKSTSSRKNKGRKLEKDVVAAMISNSGGQLTADDLMFKSMGAPGEDVVFLSEKSRQLYPLTIECSHQESFSKQIWEKYMQAVKNNPKPLQYTPIFVMKRNHCPPLVVVDLDKFLMLVRRNSEYVQALCV